MQYELRVTAPANGTRSTAEWRELAVVPGVIRRVELQFPDGCAGLVHAQVWRWWRCLWPTNPEADFMADGYVIGFEERYPMDEKPYTLWLRLWNLDDTYEHTVTLRVTLLTFGEMSTGSVRERIAGLFGGVRRL